MPVSSADTPRPPFSYVDAAHLRDAVSDRKAVDLLRSALSTDHADLIDRTPRTHTELTSGEFLLMPAEIDGYAGVKVATVAPHNPAAGRPRIQGTYVLFTADHLQPVALVDAAELTLIRTPAVTTLAIQGILAADPAGPRGSVGQVVVIGTGPQAERHARSLAANVTVGDVVILGRRPDAARALVDTLTQSGLPARPGRPSDLRDSDVVICATSSTTPVFADDQVGPDTVVAAMGAHGLTRREVPPELVLRADVVVESVESALRESGDLIPARTAEEWRRHGLVTLPDLVRGSYRRTPGRPALFTSVGMGWEDLVIAAAGYESGLHAR